MQILGLLGMYFDAAVVFVTNSLILFRLAVATGHTVSKTYENPILRQKILLKEIKNNKY